MSRPDHPSSVSGSKRAASPTTAAAEAPAQRLPLFQAAAADPPSAVRPPLSAAQRCAADVLTLVFGSIQFEELVHAARTCRGWYSAAAKEQPRGLAFVRADLLAALCTSSSPFRRHVSHVAPDLSSSLSLTRLAQLSRLPELTALEVRLSAAGLTRLMNKEGGGALAQLQAAFPPKLQELTLLMSKAHSTSACQLLLDALPALKELEELSLIPAAVEVAPGQSEVLSLEPLLQLSRLAHLKWRIGKLTVPQLRIIKQIFSLQFFDPGWSSLSLDQLSAFCRPPHRLQQLQVVMLPETIVDAAMINELVCLAALTAIESFHLMPDAYAHLSCISRLKYLRVSLNGEDDHDALLASALSACPALTNLTLGQGDCTEFACSQLLQAVPRLRTLRVTFSYLPSLRFLRHAPNLKKLSLIGCYNVRPGHVFGLGLFVPQLEFLTLEQCHGLQLDDVEVQILSPPGALGLPHLRKFCCDASAPHEMDSDSSDEDDELALPGAQ